MKKSKFSEEQVAYALRQAESGTAVADVCRQIGVSEATFYLWKKKFAHHGACGVVREDQFFFRVDENMSVPRRSVKLWSRAKFGVPEESRRDHRLPSRD